jgi:acetyl esterase
MLDQMQGMPPMHTLPVEMVRAGTLQMAAGMKAVPTPAIAGSVDLALPGPAGEIPVRIYTPEGEGPFPLLVFFHGGGFVLCNIDTHDGLCRHLCAGAGCLVVSVDYRLAPEHKFPAAPDDCLAATRWAIEHAVELGADPARTVVAGDSAGGNLAAVTALQLR